MKKIKLISTILVSFFLMLTTVKAGNCDVTFYGVDKTTVGKEFWLTLGVDNITGFSKGLSGIQGKVDYSEEYLEYVSHETMSTNMSVLYGVKTKQFVAYGDKYNWLDKKGYLLRITFKAKKPGKTSIDISSLIVKDVDNKRQDVTSTPKTIEILKEGESTSKPDDSGNTSGSTGGNTGNGAGSGTNNGSTSKPAGSTGNTSGSGTSTNTNKKDATNTLDNLYVSDAKMYPSFNKNVESYTVVVSDETTKLDLYYTPTSSKAKVSVSGNKDLKDGGNSTVKVTVTAEDGSKKVYTLNVEFSKNSSSNNKLSSLSVEEGKLSPKFDSDKNEYTVKLNKNVSKLTIDAIAADESSTVEIIDNDDLDKKKDGVVLVKVTDKNGFSNYYKLKINGGGKTLFGINIYIILGGALLLLLLLLLLFILLKKKSDEKVSTAEINLYDDIVTPTEVIDALKDHVLSHDSTKLNLLMKQDKTNKLKEKIAKEELVEAMASNDKKKIKAIQNELEDMKGGLSKEDEQMRDELLAAIRAEDEERIKALMKLEKQRNERK